MKRFAWHVIVCLVLVYTLHGKTFADGFIVMPEPHSSLPSPYPLEVVYHHVNAAVDGITAVTTVEQEFYNPLNNRIEGYYLFPVPAGAVISRFNVSVDGADSVVELLDAAKAHSIYEDIVRKQKDPALLEYAGRSLFRVRIFPIEGRSRKKVRLVYAEVLSRENNSVEYLYPLNTEKFSAGNLDDVSVTVSIKSETGIGNIYCPTHNVESVRDSGTSAVVSYREKKVRPDRDFRLFYDTRLPGVSSIVKTYRTSGNDGFFLVNMGVPLGQKPDEYIARDIVFVLDTSGSMRGEKLDQAKRALMFCIRNLNRGDRFQVIRFSNNAEALFEKLMPVERPSLAKAENFVEDLKATGGTNIQDALGMALKRYGSTNYRPHVVIFITDGKPTIGETNEDALLSIAAKLNSENIRIFTFGIGYDINTRLLDRLTEQTRSFRTYISPSENIETVIISFYNIIRSPVLANCHVVFSGVNVWDVYPAEPPDLFSGSSVTLCGRYVGHGPVEIVLGGNTETGGKEFTVKTFFSENSESDSYIPQIWASRRIGHLLDKVRFHGEQKQILAEITSLAREFGIVTPYTSYLILEDEERRIREKTLDPEHQTSGGDGRLSRELTDNMKNDYLSLRQDSGKEGVRTSKMIQRMNGVENIAQQRQSSEQVVPDKSTGEYRNTGQQLRYIEGRAVYQSGNFWVDPLLQKIKSNNRIKIRFAGREYFDLINREPGVILLLSLGRNVRFIYKNTEYEIYE